MHSTSRITLWRIVEQRTNRVVVSSEQDFCKLVEVILTLSSTKHVETMRLQLLLYYARARGHVMKNKTMMLQKKR